MGRAILSGSQRSAVTKFQGQLLQRGVLYTGMGGKIRFLTENGDYLGNGMNRHMCYYGSLIGGSIGNYAYTARPRTTTLSK